MAIPSTESPCTINGNYTVKKRLVAYLYIILYTVNTYKFYFNNKVSSKFLLCTSEYANNWRQMNMFVYLVGKID